MAAWMEVNSEAIHATEPIFPHSALVKVTSSESGVCRQGSGSGGGGGGNGNGEWWVQAMLTSRASTTTMYVMLQHGQEGDTLGGGDVHRPPQHQKWQDCSGLRIKVPFMKQSMLDSSIASIKLLQKATLDPNERAAEGAEKNSDGDGDGDGGGVGGDSGGGGTGRTAVIWTMTGGGLEIQVPGVPHVGGMTVVKISF